MLGTFSKAADRAATDRGKQRSCVASPCELTRELGALLAPEQPAKVKIPAIHRAISRLNNDITERRIRSFYNDETDRAWGDEIDALREAIRLERNRRARMQFAELVNRLMIGLAEHGAPLNAKQVSAVDSIIEAVEA